jgi:hypothetical protein
MRGHGRPARGRDPAVTATRDSDQHAQPMLAAAVLAQHGAQMPPLPPPAHESLTRDDDDDEQQQELGELVSICLLQPPGQSPPPVSHMERLASLATRGLLRDIDPITDEHISGAATMLHTVLRTALDNLSIDAGMDVGAAAPAAASAAGGGGGAADGQSSVAAGRPPLPPQGRGGAARAGRGAGWRPATVAPWAHRGGGAKGVASARPMTVAPWASARTGATSTRREGGAADAAQSVRPPPAMATSAVARAVTAASAACTIGQRLFSTPECASLLVGPLSAVGEGCPAAAGAPTPVTRAAAGTQPLSPPPPPPSRIQPRTVHRLAEVGADVARQLGSIGTHSTGLLAQAMIDGGEAAAAQEEKLVRALGTLLHRIYATFIGTRPALRAAVREAMGAAAQRLTTLRARARGARLHAMDGGPVQAAVSAAGLGALLELCTAIAQGYYSRSTSHGGLPRGHITPLWEVALPLHSPDNFIDDTTPVLGLYHRQLTLWCTSILRLAPEAIPRFVLALLTMWPKSSGANSGKEVLLLHGLETLMEHAPSSVMAHSHMRARLLSQVGACIDGSKNFRVTERALLLWKADNMRNLLRPYL